MKKSILNLIKLANDFDIQIKIIANKEYLYHETYEENLPAIIKKGLRPLSFGQSLVSDYEKRILSPEEIMDNIKIDLEQDPDNESLSDEEFEQLVKEKFEEIVDPDDLRQRTYIYLQQPSKLSYADILLRFPKSSAGLIEKDCDYYISETILPEDIEILQDGEWKKIINN